LPVRDTGGYTLIEVLIATACAAILSLAAWNGFVTFHKVHSYFVRTYDGDSRNALEKIRHTKRAVLEERPGENRF
jgi:prepilin-type N-terminal cleavage/methylation domain-containing protein